MCCIGQFMWGQTQNIFVCTSNELWKVDPFSCGATLVGPLANAYADIAFTPDGKLYGTSWGQLYSIDTITAVSTLISGGTYGNSLVGALSGALYGTSFTNLIRIDPVTGAITTLGDTGFTSAGDMTFFGGSLYFTDINGSLIKVDTINPPASYDVGNTGQTSIFSLVNVVSGCDEYPFMITVDNEVFPLDYLTATTGTPCTVNLPSGAAGAASLTAAFGATHTDYFLGNDVYTCDTSYFLPFANAEHCLYYWEGTLVQDSVFIDSSGTYVAEMIDTLRNCHYYDTIIVDFGFPPIVDLPNDTSICDYPQPFVIDAQNIGSDFLWQNGDTTQSILVDSSGLYTVIVDNGYCASSDSMLVEFLVEPVNFGQFDTLCNGSVLFLNSNNPDGAHVWSDNSTNPTLLVDEAGTYWVTVMANGCVDSDTVEVIEQVISVDFEADITAGCPDLLVQFNNLSSTNIGGLLTQFWSVDNTFFSLNQPSTYTFTESGYYDITLQVLSTAGCYQTLTKSDYIWVYPQPKAGFHYSPHDIMVDEPLQLNNYSIDYTDFEWIIDNEIFNEESPEITLTTEDMVRVDLIVSNDFECRDSTFKYIQAAADVQLIAPNAFTPGQGPNQSWRCYVNGVDPYDFTLTVYNRWGELIWLSHDPNIAWDGRYQDHLVESGVYIWKVVFSDTSTEDKQMFTGHITVLY